MSLVLLFLVLIDCLEEKKDYFSRSKHFPVVGRCHSGQAEFWYKDFSLLRN